MSLPRLLSTAPLRARPSSRAGVSVALATALVGALTAAGCAHRGGAGRGEARLDLTRALETCAEETRAARDEPGDEGRRLAAAVACAEAQALRYPRCAEAWRRAPHHEPSSMVASVLTGCRDAYCPDLPEPKPAICEGELPPPGPEQLRMSTELFQAVDAIGQSGREEPGEPRGAEDGDERGVERGVEGKPEGSPDRAPAAAPGPAPAAPGTTEKTVPVLLSVSESPEGLRLSVESRVAVVVPPRELLSALAVLLEPAARRAVVVVPGAGLDHEEVNGIVGAVRSLGFTSVTTSRSPAETPPETPAGMVVTIVVSVVGTPEGLRLSAGERSVVAPPDGDVAAALLGLVGPAEGRRLGIAADRDLPYADMVRVIDAARAAGFEKYALMVTPAP